LTRRPAYAAVAAALLVVEILIALFVRDRFVRPYLGDTLAVILVYAALRAVTPLGVLAAATISFGIAVAIELGQYFRVLDALGLAHNQIARTVLGTGFEPRDFVAYGAGALIAVAAERLLRRRV
jgi:hypothetical protein